jgi:hypothetical protein
MSPLALFRRLVLVLLFTIGAPAAYADYVTGLNPAGHNALALRAGPGSSYEQIGRMGPDTLVTVKERRGNWLQIELEDGSKGWAYGKYIAAGTPPAAAGFGGAQFDNFRQLVDAADTSKTSAEFIADALHHTSAGFAVLGRYIADSPDSYERVGERLGGLYFSTPDWDELQTIAAPDGGTAAAVLNEAFVDHIIAARLPVVFSSNPLDAPRTSALWAEYSLLAQAGYSEPVQAASGYFASCPAGYSGSCADVSTAPAN